MRTDIVDMITLKQLIAGLDTIPVMTSWYLSESFSPCPCLWLNWKAVYNLDIIISVGYRVKSQRGTQFRIWAATILKDHLVRGYSLNQRRPAEKGVEDLRQVLSLPAGALESHNLVTEEEWPAGSKKLQHKALVALALLTAASEPGQKKLMVRLIVNLISEEG